MTTKGTCPVFARHLAQFLKNCFAYMFFHTFRLIAFVVSEVIRQILDYLVEDIFVGRVTQFNSSDSGCLILNIYLS
jgi:hypothetical protein